ncbi:MAG: hypothetical protein WC508_05875 [Patescibacteria group bacterium]
MKKGQVTRGQAAGIKMGEATLEWLHMMYNQQTANRVLAALIERLQKGQSEFDQK